MFDWLALSLSRIEAEKNRTPPPNTDLDTPLSKRQIRYKSPVIPYRALLVGETWGRWQRGHALVTSDSQVRVFTRHGFAFTAAELRWYGRLTKYQRGENDILLHLELRDRWYTLHLRMSYYHLGKFVAALKTVAPAAYAPRAPHPHYGPVSLPGGEWLYITPAHVVITDGIRLRRVFRRRDVRAVEGYAGVLRFKARGESFVFVHQGAATAAAYLRN